MGNRATIYIPASRKTVCLQWQGGKGSIQAFMHEAKKRAAFNGKIEKDFIFYLHSAIRDFFNFSGDNKEYRKRDQLSLYIESGEVVNNEDNGHYTLKSNGNIDYSAMQYIETAQYTKDSRSFILSFFEQLDKIIINAEFSY